MPSIHIALILVDAVVNQIIKCLIPRENVAADCVINVISKMCANAISVNIQVFIKFRNVTLEIRLGDCLM